MNCPNCNHSMSFGAPHCETIKSQKECHRCGHIEAEYYTSEEQQINRLAGSTNKTFTECRKALIANNYNVIKAEEELLKS